MKRQLRMAAILAALTCAALAIERATAAPAAAPAKPVADESLAPIVEIKPDPAVDSVVDSHPQTAGELLRAAVVLADLDRPDLARKYLQQLAAAKPSEDALAEAIGIVDSPMLLRLVGNKDLQPEAAQLAQAALAAGARLSDRPDRVQAAIKQMLDSPSLGQRRQALARILAGHEHVVPVLVSMLSTPAQAEWSNYAPQIRQALIGLGPEAVAPLAAALASDDVGLKVQVLRVLGEIGSSDAMMYLAAPATAPGSPPAVREAAQAALEKIQNVRNATADDAAKLLSSEIIRSLARERFMVVDPGGTVEVWRWQPKTQSVIVEKMPVRWAASAMAARLAGDLMQVASNDPIARRLFLVSTLGEADFRSRHFAANPGLVAGDEVEQSIKRATELGAAALDDALAYAIKAANWPAAVQAAQILGKIGDRSLLDAHGPQLRPLVTALDQGDRRLRFAAAEAVMKLSPTTGFAGSSALMSTLAWFGSSPGPKRALVAFPNEMIAGQLAAMLRELGYEADYVANGHRALLAGIASADYELVLLSSHLDRPPVWVALDEMWHNPHTAGLSVGLLAENATDDLDRMKILASDTINLPPGGLPNDAPILAFERPFQLSALKFFVEQLAEKANGDGDIVPQEIRAQQAAASLVWLKQLNAASSKEFDLRPFEAAIIRALVSPITSVAAADLLAVIGSHTAQKALIDLANNSSQPLELRQAAAAAFSRATRKYGIQLTTVEIQQQYERYNTSAGEEVASQQLLALILDAIELPTRQTRR